MSFPEPDLNDPFLPDHTTMTHHLIVTPAVTMGLPLALRDRPRMPPLSQMWALHE